MIGCSEPSVSRDISFINQTSRDNLKHQIETRLPQEFEKTLLGLNAILKESWIMADRAANQREKHAALSLAKEWYSVRLDLLTNAGAINEAIDFVKREQERKERKENKENDNNDNNTNEYTIDDDLELELELEHNQEKETTE